MPPEIIIEPVAPAGQQPEASRQELHRHVCTSISSKIKSREPRKTHSFSKNYSSSASMASLFAA